MPSQDRNCKPCKKVKIASPSKDYNFVLSVLLAILPKCPFCIMAYSSTVMLCSRDTLIESRQDHYSTLSIIFTAFFCLLIIAGLLLNFHGKRTKYALALSSIGILMITNSVIRNGGQELYYLGVSIVFIAVWLNGSLISIFRKLKNTFSDIRRTAESNPYS